MADGGTLFLDEIGDISLKTQVKLLRVLEDEDRRGSAATTTIHVDFRVVAATNQTWKRHGGRGKFREDLYYRLNVFSIAIPPLRERRRTFRSLADHFLTRFARST